MAPALGGGLPQADTLVRQLKRASAVERRGSLKAFGQMGAAAAPHVGLIAARLEDPDAEVRCEALVALGGLGPFARAHAHNVAGRLQDVDPRVRAAAAALLGRLGAASLPHTKALVATLEDADAEARGRAVEALGLLGPPAAAKDPAAPAAAARLLGDGEAPVRAAAAEALLQFREVSAEPAAGLLESEDPTARAAAVDVLQRLGRWAAVVAERLRRRLQDAEPLIRAAAVEALESTGSAGFYSADLARSLRDSDVEVRCRALSALGRLGADAAGAHAPAVAELLEDPAPSVREASAASLGCLGAPGERHAVALVRRLGDSNAEVWWRAVQVLSRMGPIAASCLAEALEDPDPEVRVAAAAGLGHMGKTAAAHAGSLAGRLEDLSNPVRRTATGALACCLGAATAEDREVAAVIETLPGCLEDEDPIIRRRAADALASLPGGGGSGGGAAGLGDAAVNIRVEAVAARLLDDDASARFSAETALAEMARASAAPSEVAIAQLKHPKEAIRRHAAAALGRRLCWLPPAADGAGEAGAGAAAAPPRAVAGLAGLLKDSSATVRLTSAKALGRLGAYHACSSSDGGGVGGGSNSAPSSPTAATIAALAGAATELGGLLDWRQRGGRKPDALMRRAAAEALGGLGPHAVPQAPKLAELLQDYDPLVSERAAEALGRIGICSEAPSSARHAVASAVCFDRRPAVRGAATRALGLMRSAEHAEDLGRRLKDPDTAVRRHATEALWRLGRRGAEALAEKLGDADPEVRGGAAEALRLMGEPAAPFAEQAARASETAAAPSPAAAAAAAAPAAAAALPAGDQRLTAFIAKAEFLGTTAAGRGRTEKQRA